MTRQVAWQIGNLPDKHVRGSTYGSGEPRAIHDRVTWMSHQSLLACGSHSVKLTRPD
jgi:hypothetical protein